MSVILWMYGLIAVGLMIKTKLEEGKKRFKLYLIIAVLWILPSVIVMLIPILFFIMLMFDTQRSFHIG